MDAIPPDVKPEIKLNYEVVSSNRIKVVNWWGFGLEIFLMIAEEDYRDLTQVIVYIHRILSYIIHIVMECVDGMANNC